MAEGGGGSPGQESSSDSAAVGSHAVVGGQADQGGGGGNQGVVDQGSGNMGDSGGGLHHALHHGGLHNWAGNTKWEGWSSEGGWSNGSHWGWDGSDNWRCEEGSSHWDGLTDGINKPVLIEVLGESLQREWSQTALSRDKISESGGKRSSNLWVGLSLVETMNRLVAGSRERPCVAGAVVGSVEVGVTVRGIIVQRISFRFCQAERGDNENSDLKKNIKNLLLEDEVEDDELTMHFMFV